MNGFLLIDKPEGITSFGVVARVRRILGIQKVGHCGTLDPQATGLLIVCLGKATKLAQFVTKESKTYRAEITFGSISTTLDRDGEITDYPDAKIPSLEDVQGLLPLFSGDIEQSAPMYSAVKHQGKPLYKYARKNQEVEQKIRRVHIDNISILSFVYPLLVIEVTCSSGTYVRSIAHDLGKQLGCGGYISNLRRTSVGKWRLEDSTKIEDLPVSTEESLIDLRGLGNAFIPMEQMLEMPTLHVTAPRAPQVAQGVPLRLEDLMTSEQPLLLGQLVALLGLRDELLAVGRMRCNNPIPADWGNQPVVDYVRVI
jgi:tRNA pseudouridine55 synthase